MSHLESKYNGSGEEAVDGELGHNHLGGLRHPLHERQGNSVHLLGRAHEPVARGVRWRGRREGGG